MTKKKTRTGLSKSLYLKGLQCRKALWLKKFRPELAEEPDAAAEARFMSGHEVGTLAQHLFPGGIEIPYEGLSIKEQLQQTTVAMKSHKVIYEASFEYDGIFIKVDILRKGRRGWELYEVKSATETKDVNLEDVALQYYVLRGAGIAVTKAFVVHLNNSYIRQGELDLEQLFFKDDVTATAKEWQDGVEEEVQALKKVMRKTKVPHVDIGPHCFDPYDCEFESHCWAHIPDESVFELSGGMTKKFALYQEGIVDLRDIPLERLAKKQRQEVESRLNKQMIFEREKVKDFVDELWYPLCFLDFETFQSALPLYDGTKPYQQIPFQYSLHLLKRKNGKLRHREFLAQPNHDPRRELLERLLDDIPDDACVLTYNASFETTVLKSLAAAFPRKTKKIQRLIDNVRDLIVPFRTRAVYHWKMQGSASIKNVLPALVPELSYADLEIADGGAAMEAWSRMCAAQSAEELASIRKALLEYCGLDTFAMVKIFAFLMEKLE